MNKKLLLVIALPLMLGGCSSNAVEEKTVDSLAEYKVYRTKKAFNAEENLECQLTINYLDQTGTKVAEPYIDKMDADSSYFVIPPTVEGLTPNVPYVEGYVTGDRTIDVIYSEESVWDGSISSSFSGLGLKTSPYLIQSASDLALLAKKETTDRTAGSADPYNGKYFKVTKNINLNGIEWTPIASNFAANYNKPFTANFDGDNHLIRGLSINKPDGISYGLFGALNDSGTIKNLNVEGNVTAKSRVGILLSCANKDTTKIENCKTFGKAHCTGNVSNSQYLGAICSVNKGAISNCVNFAEITADYGGIGGIVGANSATITDCDNFGKVQASATQTAVGGIVGTLAANSTSITNSNNFAPFEAVNPSTGGILGEGNSKTFTITNCNNFGRFDVSTTSVGGIVGTINNASSNILQCNNFGYFNSTSTYCGGIVGHVKPGLVSECSNYGDFETTEKFNGGVIGSAYSTGTLVDGCKNYGNVKGVNQIGGIAGYITQDIKNSVNYGSVSGEVEVAGLVGYLNQGRMDNCVNNGSINATTSKAGGLVGYLYGAAGSENNYVKNSSNAGTITSLSYSGGCVGHCLNSIVDHCSNSGKVLLTGESAGGVIGHLTDSSVATNLSNTGDIEGIASIGGCIGYAGASTTVKNLETSGLINGVYSDTKTIGTDKHIL
ncbi:MAG: hypothetical protein MJ239_03345 [Bacilli bacterium]|nr:hypothetical protein [Bacilli bacterium]